MSDGNEWFGTIVGGGSGVTGQRAISPISIPTAFARRNAWKPRRCTGPSARPQISRRTGRLAERSSRPHDRRAVRARRARPVSVGAARGGPDHLLRAERRVAVVLKAIRRREPRGCRPGCRHLRRRSPARPEDPPTDPRRRDRSAGEESSGGGEAVSRPTPMHEHYPQAFWTEAEWRQWERAGRPRIPPRLRLSAKVPKNLDPTPVVQPTHMLGGFDLNGQRRPRAGRAARPEIDRLLAKLGIGVGESPPCKRRMGQRTQHSG